MSTSANRHAGEHLWDVFSSESPHLRGTWAPVVRARLRPAPPSLHHVVPLALRAECGHIRRDVQQEEEGLMAWRVKAVLPRTRGSTARVRGRRCLRKSAPSLSRIFQITRARSFSTESGLSGSVPPTRRSPFPESGMLTHHAECQAGGGGGVGPAREGHSSSGTWLCSPAEGEGERGAERPEIHGRGVKPGACLCST